MSTCAESTRQWHRMRNGIRRSGPSPAQTRSLVHVRLRMRGGAENQAGAHGGAGECSAVNTEQREQFGRRAVRPDRKAGARSHWRGRSSERSLLEQSENSSETGQGPRMRASADREGGFWATSQKRACVETPAQACSQPWWRGEDRAPVRRRIFGAHAPATAARRWQAGDAAVLPRNHRRERDAPLTRAIQAC